MTPDDVLITSPLFMVHPRRGNIVAIDLISGQRFNSLAAEVLELANTFLTPTRVGDAVDCGHSPIAVVAALDAGVLIAADSEAAASAQLWEDRRWSRAAYLLLSQQNLLYTEPTDGVCAQEELVDLRRNTIRQFMLEREYPPLRQALTKRIIGLPSPRGDERAFNLDLVFRRRSKRRFANEPLAIDVFSRVLHSSTTNVRIANNSKKSGDPFFLLNSFYSWLQVYVVVQNVLGIERGVYQYDPEAHELRTVAVGTTDDDILNCIQHQNWIAGGGYCAFFVVQWNRYQWLYRHSRAYVNLLIQLGEIGQEMLQQAYSCELGAWTTPAIHESAAADLLHLDVHSEDAMYFMKVGPLEDQQ